MSQDQFGVEINLSVPAATAEQSEFAPATTDATAEEAESLRLGLESPDAYFVHIAPGQPPLVVEHATGEPKFRVADGSLVPLA